MLEWVAISSSRDSSLRRDLTHVSCVFCRAGGSLPAEPPGKPPSYTLLLLFSGPVMSNSATPTHCSTPGLPVCHHLWVSPSSCSLHQWCHPAVSSSDALFSFCPQSFSASGIFPMSCLFPSDDQNTGASASASVLLVKIQGWSPLRLTDLILLSKGLSGVFSSTTGQRQQFFGVLPSLQSSSHNRKWPLGRP